MNELVFASGYAADTEKREALYPLFETVFGIPADELRDFYSRGLWDPAYCPYTWFAGTGPSFVPVPYEAGGRLMVRGLLGQELGMLRIQRTAVF